MAPVYLPESGFYHQMAIAPIPLYMDMPTLKERLYSRYRIEIPSYTWQNRHFVRISVQGYVTEADLDALVEALEVELR